MATEPKMGKFCYNFLDADGQDLVQMGLLDSDYSYEFWLYGVQGVSMFPGQTPERVG